VEVCEFSEQELVRACMIRHDMVEYDAERSGVAWFDVHCPDSSSGADVEDFLVAAVSGSCSSAKG
jgi:hypothetical protein